jgi:hypothetical protein
MATTRDVLLFGLNHHNYQFPDTEVFIYASQEERNELRHSLLKAISERGVRGIAEEMSLEALEKRSISGGSTVSRFARQVGLPYRDCDRRPRESNEQREQTWIDELSAFGTFPVLFVLGASHIESFEGLLSKSGFQPFVIVRDWKGVQSAKRCHLTNRWSQPRTVRMFRCLPS